jgi:hypothetical protein
VAPARRRLGAGAIGFEGGRGLATRHEKRARNYRAKMVLAAVVIWLDP